MVRFWLAAVAVAIGIPTASAENWPAWRGPHGDGYSADTGFPVHWSATENVKWKTLLPGPGNSTPVVWGPKVFVSCASDEGHRRSLICFDRQTGHKQWEQHVDYDQDEQTHASNPFCSSSPVTDGQRVIVWHGSAGVHAYDLDGHPLWKRSLGKFEHIWGTGSSPVLYRNLVILNCGPGLRAFLVALDAVSGEEIWRREYPEMVSAKVSEFRGSWSTPVIAPRGDHDELLISLPLRLHALDPLTGRELWSCGGLGKLSYTSPLVCEKGVVAMSGFHGPAMAVQWGGQGDVTETHRLWWHDQKNPQRVGSGIVVGAYIYILNEPGIAWCMELATGEILWKQRLGTAASWSSMSYAEDRLYITNMDGTTLVLKPDPAECAVLAENPLGERTRASLAFSNGQIFARTYTHLYCFELTKPLPQQ